jgi:hypothetical protein
MFPEGTIKLFCVAPSGRIRSLLKKIIFFNKVRAKYKKLKFFIFSPFSKKTIILQLLLFQIYSKYAFSYTLFLAHSRCTINKKSKDFLLIPNI